MEIAQLFGDTGVLDRSGYDTCKFENLGLFASFHTFYSRELRCCSSRFYYLLFGPGLGSIQIQMLANVFEFAHVTME